jgi:hypothetical protein
MTVGKSACLDELPPLTGHPPASVAYSWNRLAGIE